MKKIFTFVGSLRSESYNRKVFETYKKISKDTFEFSECDLTEFPHYNEDINPAPSAVEHYSSLINNSDGIIVFSPEYNYGLPGVLKNAIDWLSKSESKPFEGALGSVVGASPGKLGTARMQYEFRKMCVALNIQLLNRPEVMISNVFELYDGNELRDKGTQEFIEKHVKAFDAFLDRK